MLLLSGPGVRGTMDPPAHTTMIDLIFIAVTFGFFVFGALYARYCESL